MRIKPQLEIGGTRPVLHYAVPIADWKRMRLRRKPGHPFKARGWITLHYRQYGIEELRALAHCKGITLNMLLRAALGDIKENTERMLGITGNDAKELSLRQRAELARKFRLVNGVTLCSMVDN